MDGFRRKGRGEGGGGGGGGDRVLARKRRFRGTRASYALIHLEQMLKRFGTPSIMWVLAFYWKTKYVTITAYTNKNIIINTNKDDER